MMICFNWVRKKIVATIGYDERMKGILCEKEVV